MKELISYKQMIFFKPLMILTTLLFFCGCTSDPSEKYANLSHEQKEILFKEIQNKVINDLVCSNFGEDIVRFKNDLSNKNLDTSWFYFKDYPFQFKILVENPYSDSLIKSTLNAKGVKNIEGTIKNYPTPNIEDLTCQDVISKWNIEKYKSENLRKSLPFDFYRKYTTIDYYIDEIIEWIKTAFKNVVLFIISMLIIGYAFALHYGLIVQKNKEGLWLIIATPLASIPLQGYLNTLLHLGMNFWQRLLITSLIFSVISSCICFIYLSTQKRE